MAHTPEYNARRRNEYKRLRALGYEPDQARSLRRVSPAPRRPVPFNYSGDPLANFRRWSRPKVGFPSRALAWIYKANDDAGQTNMRRLDTGTTIIST